MDLGSWAFPLLRVPGAAPGEKDRQCQHTAEHGRAPQPRAQQGQTPLGLGMAAAPSLCQGSAPLGEPRAQPRCPARCTSQEGLEPGRSTPHLPGHARGAGRALKSTPGDLTAAAIGIRSCVIFRYR